MKRAAVIGGGATAVVTYGLLLDWKTRRALRAYNDLNKLLITTFDQLSDPKVVVDREMLKKQAKNIDQQLDRISLWVSSWNPLYEWMNKT
jgi:hypothetical protein